MSHWDGLTPPYATIVADPPWAIAKEIRAGGRRRASTSVPYSFLSDDDIGAMDIGALAGPDAHLYLWVTADRNRRGVGCAVAAAWGFKVIGEIVWEKPNLGMGSFPRVCHEVVLVARRGAVPFAGVRNVRSVQHWPQVYATNGGKTHSAKPPAFFDLVEASSPGPYVELFARQPRLGWDSWGFGYENAVAVGSPSGETQ